MYLSPGFPRPNRARVAGLRAQVRRPLRAPVRCRGAQRAVTHLPAVARRGAPAHGAVPVQLRVQRGLPGECLKVDTVRVAYLDFFFDRYVIIYRWIAYLIPF